MTETLTEDLPPMANDFEARVIHDLAALQTGVCGINQRLDRVNGSISHLWEKHNQLEINLTEHPLQCPIRDEVKKLSDDLLAGSHPGSHAVNTRVSNLEDWQKTTLASRSTSKKWLDWIRPILWLVAGAIAYVLLTHIDQWLKNVKP